MLKRVLQPQRFFKMGAAAAAVGLIAVMAIASPASACETLGDLDGTGLGFTVGGVTFVTFNVNDSETTVNPDNVFICPIEDPAQPGFKVEPRGEMAGDGQSLVYSFLVSGFNLQGAVLNLTYPSYSPASCNDAQIDLDLIDDANDPGLELEVNWVAPDGEQIDVDVPLNLPSPLFFDTRATTTLNSCSTVELRAYEIRVITFPFSPSFDVAYVSQTTGCDGNTPCYDSVQAAVDGVDSFTEIRITSDDYGAVSLSDPKILILSGGWTSDYSDQSGETTVNSLEINDGSFYDTQFIAMDGLGP